MRKGETPVIAAIPAYNAEATIGTLLEQVLAQGYDAVYLLDDASTDNTLEVAYRYPSDIEVVAGKENLGSGANRNRIIPELGNSAIIHFIDSDVELNSEHSPEIIRDLGSVSNLGYAGGMVRNPNGDQNPFNYGPRPSLRNDMSAGIQYLSWLIGSKNRKAGKAIRNGLGEYLKDWPNIYEAPDVREVFWASEANMVIPSDVFRRSGGYDPRFRYSEIFDYSIRLERLGLIRLFDPFLDVTHKSVDTASGKVAGRRAAAKLLRNIYGQKQYFLGK